MLWVAMSCELLISAISSSRLTKLHEGGALAMRDKPGGIDTSSARDSVQLDSGGSMHACHTRSLQLVY